MCPSVQQSKEPIRLFQSDVLEFFTHTHPTVVPIIWTPVAAYCLIRAIAGHPEALSPLYIPAGVLLGLFVWTLAEYTVHRFVFHFRPRAPWQERLSFMAHGVHHAQPMVKTRLVMPPAVSLPLALVFYGLFWLVVGAALGLAHWVFPLFAGFIVGYILYDLTHYSLHHFRLRWGYLQSLRKHHLYHHSQTPNKRFGVTTILWDVVFRTEPDRAAGGRR